MSGIEKIFPLRTRTFLALGVLLPAIFAGIPATIAYHTKSELAGSFEMVAHALDVEKEIQHLQSDLLNAEAAQRSFLASHRESHLLPYYTALEGIEESTQALRRLTADNPHQHRKLDLLAEILTEKLAMLAKPLETKQDAGEVASDQEEILTESIRKMLVLMTHEEQRALSERQEKLYRESHRDDFVMAGFAILGVFASATVLVALRRLSRAEMFVKMCAWSRRIHYHGEWLSVEDFLSRRFNITTSHGISPGEASKLAKECAVMRK